jgi:hypothetical protein
LLGKKEGRFLIQPICAQDLPHALSRIQPPPPGPECPRRNRRQTLSPPGENKPAILKF